MTNTAKHVLERAEPFCLVSQQSSDLPNELWRVARPLFRSIMSAEHGFFGAAAAGEETASGRHPLWGIPIHSLYGKTRNPTPEMLRGVKRVVVDLQDIGVRCYTYLATLKNVLEAAGENGIAVTVADRPIPVGGPAEGPMMEEKWQSFVGPVNLPMRHGMTSGECARWMVETGAVAKIDLTVIPVAGWDHALRGPWQNFMPPSPGIKSWDAAALYPATVFTEAFPAIDCDRAGTYAFRVVSYPGINAEELAEELSAPLLDCGFTVRAFSVSGKEALLARLADGGKVYRPCEAGIRILAAALQKNPALAKDARPEWMAKLYGSMDIYDRVISGDIEPLFPSWRNATF